MKKILLTLVTMSAVFIPMCSIANNMVFSGDDFIKLYKDHTNQSPQSRAFSYGFVNGAYLQLLATIHMKSNTKYFECWDYVNRISVLTLHEVFSVFDQYLNNHPHDTHKPAIDLFDTAFLNKFPVQSAAVDQCIKSTK